MGSCCQWRHSKDACITTEILGTLGVSIDPFLGPSVTPVTSIKHNLVAGSFAAWFWSGSYSHGHRVKDGSVTDALSAISNTIKLAGKPSQFYCSDGKYQLFSEMVVKGFWRNNPPTVLQLAVPVMVPQVVCCAGLATTTPGTRRIGCLVMVVFYFLLQVGEYTKPRRV